MAGRLDPLDHLLRSRRILAWFVVVAAQAFLGHKFPCRFFHVSALCSDDILQKFWETEESPKSPPSFLVEEWFVVEHFLANHSHAKSGTFVVPLPQKPDTKPIGDSRSQVIRRFLALSSRRRSSKKSISYLELGHAFWRAGQGPCNIF